LFLSDTWVYEDGRDEVVLCVDKPCQLLGVGLCSSDSGYTAILDVLRVADDFSEEVGLEVCNRGAWSYVCGTTF